MAQVKGFDVNLVDPVNSQMVTTEDSPIANATYCTFHVKKSYSFNCFICKAPTSNCQLSSFGSMNMVIEYVYNQTEKKEDKKENVLAVVRECYRLCKFSKPLLILVDVKRALCPAVEDCFTVVMKTPYTSTNRSEMCLYLVKLPEPPAPAPTPPPPIV